MAGVKIPDKVIRLLRASLAGTVLFALAVDAPARPVPVKLDSPWLIDVWETDDGLPHPSVVSIAQTPDGFLWLGTFEGLARYDGVEFEVFGPGNKPGPPSKAIRNLLVDGRGRLWVGTPRNISVLDTNGWRSFGTNEGWPETAPDSLAEDADGHLVASASKRRLFRFDGARFAPVRAPTNSAADARLSLLRDTTGTLWVNSSNYLGRFASNDWVSALAPAEIPAGGIIGVGAARAGGLWVADRKELRWFKDGAWLASRPQGDTNISQNDLSQLLEDHLGNVWETAINRGLWKHRPDGTTNYYSRRNGLGSSLVRTVFQDREKNLWIGTGGGGLARFKQRAVTTWSDDHWQPQNILKSVATNAAGGLWVGALGGGLSCLTNDHFGRVPTRRGRPPGNVWSILVDRAERIWVGTLETGLFRVEDGQLTAVAGLAPRNVVSIFALFEDRDGAIWMGTDRGLVQWSEGQIEKFGKSNGLPAASIRSLAQMPDGRLVLGTEDAGAYFFDGTNFQRFTTVAHVGSEEIWALRAEADGTLWLGTGKGGLSRYRNGQFARFSTKEGLPSDSIGSILDDSAGHLWLGSKDGILRVARGDLEAVAAGRPGPLRPLLFNKSDGMESAECALGYQPAAARDHQGRLWYATLKGLSMIDPSMLPINTRAPDVVIVEMKADDKEMLGGNAAGVSGAGWRPGAPPLLVPAGTRRIEVRYAGLSLTAPEKNRYATRVEGQDQHWIEVGNRRTAYLPFLDPGQYRFQVRAANNDGVWNDTPASLDFVVLPFVWQTWWFRLAAVLGFVALVALAGWVASRRSLQGRMDMLEREKQLALTEARLASVLENTSDFVSFTDPQGRLIYVNQAGRKMVGLSPDTDVIERTVRELHPAWAANRILEEGLPAAGQRGVWHGETALWHPGGYEIPVSQVIVAHRNPDGSLSFFSSIVRDIGEAKKSEQGLRDREERFRMAAEQTGQLVYDYNIPTGLIRWLGAIQAVTGYTPEAFNASMDLHGWAEQIHPDDRRAALARLDIALRDGTPYELQYRFRREDGTYFFAQDKGVFQRDASGRIVRMLGAMQDITLFRKADDAREMLRRMAQSLTGPLTTRQIALLLAEECRGLFLHEAFFLDLNDEKTNRRSSVYCEDTPPGEDAPREVPSSIDPVPPENFRTAFHGDPVLLNRLEEPAGSEFTAWGFKDRLSRSLMLAPIRWEGRCIGVLSVQSYTPGRYGQRDLELLQSLADHCGAAVARTEADAALRNERNFIAALLDTVGSLVVVLDTAGRIVRFNEACVKATGYHAAEVLGQEPWGLLVAPEDRDRVRKGFVRLVGGEHSLRGENSWITRDGSRRLIAWDNTVLPDKDGKVQFVIATGMDITDRLTAERALLESEQRFELAVRGSSDGLWDRNLLTEEVFYSERYKEQLGYAPEEFASTYESFWSHLHPDDRPHVEAAQRAHFEERSPYDIELRLRTKFGTYRWFRSRAQAIWDTSGRAIRMAGAHTDITSSKLAEEALRQGEALLTQTNRIAQVGGWELDVATHQFTWTPELYHLHEVVAGFTPTIEESFDFFAPACRDAVRQAFEQCLRDGKPWDIEGEFTTAAGRRLWIHTQGEAQYDQGKVRRIVGALQDITRRKRAEEALSAVAAGTAGVSGEDFFRSLVRHLALALGVRHAFVAQMIGPEAKRVRALCIWSGDKLGEPFEYDLAGTPCSEAVGPSICFYPHSVTESFPADPMLRHLRAESYIGAPIFNTQKKLIGLLAVVHDRPISEGDESKSIVAIFAARAGAELERIHAEQRVLQLNAELEQRVRERTAQLLAANQEMQAFSYSVSHDLRAPLRHLAGFTNLLERNPAVIANPEAQRHASVVNEAARKMGQLIDDLLVFSRMGRQEMKRKSIDTSLLVDECLRDLQPEMQGRRIEWKRGALPAVMADAAMMRQVWLNLLSNAIKYSRRCDPAIIEIGGQEIGDQFVFAVKDNGAGFDMKYSEKLFGVFQRLHRDEEFEGTGIGLANVRRIVHRHGGHTWAIGATDQGATFYFSLPKTPAETELFAQFPAIPVPPSERE